jgi:hypothetical protein
MYRHCMMNPFTSILSVEDAEADEQPRRDIVDKAWPGVVVGGKVNHESPFRMNRHSMT